MVTTDHCMLLWE